LLPQEDRPLVLEGKDGAHEVHHCLIDGHEEQPSDETLNLGVTGLVVEEGQTNQAHEDVLADLDSPVAWVPPEALPVAPHEHAKLLAEAHFDLVLGVDLWQL